MCLARHRGHGLRRPGSFAPASALLVRDCKSAVTRPAGQLPTEEPRRRRLHRWSESSLPPPCTRMEGRKTPALATREQPTPSARRVSRALPSPQTLSQQTGRGRRRVGYFGVPIVTFSFTGLPPRRAVMATSSPALTRRRARSKSSRPVIFRQANSMEKSS